MEESIKSATVRLEDFLRACARTDGDGSMILVDPVTGQACKIPARLVFKLFSEMTPPPTENCVAWRAA